MTATILPVLMPMLFTVLCLLGQRHRWNYWAALAGALALLAASANLVMTVIAEGTQIAAMGGWAPPFGILFVADLLSAAMVLITGVVAVAVILFAKTDIGENERGKGYFALVFGLLTGVCGAFLTGDMFNLYVWFEVMLIASFGLLVTSQQKIQVDGAVKYVGLNLIATLSFLTGLALLYGAAGSLTMVDLHGVLAGRSNEGAVLAAAAFLLFAFCAKAAVFPLFSWLPASYHTPSVATSALFAALLTKVGVYALLRVFTLVFDIETAAIQNTLLVAALFTMVVGVLGAAAQNSVRKILGFHIVSQIGYMVLGLAIYTPLAVIGSVFYLFHHIIVKANLFFLAGLIHRATGSEALDRTGGLWKSLPWLGVLFLIPALSLAGLPPLSGFWAKLIIVAATLEAEAWISAFAALAVGLLTLFSMSKIWLGAFWKPHPDPSFVPAKLSVWQLAPVIILALMTVTIGLFAGPVYDAAVTAAAPLLDPGLTVQAVKGAFP